MESPNTNLFELQIDQSSQMYLRETAKWGKFIAIVGFIMCCLIVLAGVFAGSIFAATSSQFSAAYSAGLGVGAAVFYICFALVCFFPYLFLLRFSNQMLAALRTNDQQLLNSSFRNQRACYKYVGILTIILLAIYALILVFAGFGAMVAAGRR